MRCKCKRVCPAWALWASLGYLVFADNGRRFKRYSEIKEESFAKAAFRQDVSQRTLRDSDAGAFRDHGLEIDAAPADYARPPRGPAASPRLYRVQRAGLRSKTVSGLCGDGPATLQASGVIAVNPIALRSRARRAVARRGRSAGPCLCTSGSISPGCAVQNRSQCQQTPRLARITDPPCLAAQTRRRKTPSRDCNGHGSPKRNSRFRESQRHNRVNPHQTSQKI
jgi:hypothetical protein